MVYGQHGSGNPVRGLTGFPLASANRVRHPVLAWQARVAAPVYTVCNTSHNIIGAFLASARPSGRSETNLTNPVHVQPGFVKPCGATQQGSPNPVGPWRQGSQNPVGRGNRVRKTLLGRGHRVRKTLLGPRAQGFVLAWCSRPTKFEFCCSQVDFTSRVRLRLALNLSALGGFGFRFRQA